MNDYVVIEYEAVDTSGFGTRQAGRHCGAPGASFVIQAADPAEAIRFAAGGREGFFSAIEIPSGLPITEMKLVAMNG